MRSLPKTWYGSQPDLVFLFYINKHITTHESGFYKYNFPPFLMILIRQLLRFYPHLSSSCLAYQSCHILFIVSVSYIYISCVLTITSFYIHIYIYIYIQRIVMTNNVYQNIVYDICSDLGTVCVISIGIAIIKIRRSHDRLIFIMQIAYMERPYLYWDGALLGRGL